MGFFVNSIFFSINVDYQEPFIDFIRRVNTAAAEVLQHQGYPLELVCKELKIKYPDVPASFNMLNIRDESVDLSIESIETGHTRNMQDVKFDLEVYVNEFKNGISLFWAYKKSLFDPIKIDGFIEIYMNLIDFFKDNLRESYSQYRAKKKKRSFKRNN